MASTVDPMPSSSPRAQDRPGRIVWTSSEVRRLLQVPGRDDDKHSRGVVALRTGSEAYPGAAVLGSEAAWRAGSGYVHYVGPRRPADLILARRPETVVTDPLLSSGSVRADAWVIGSGTDAATRPADETAALRGLLAGDVPVVVDAGALDLLPATAPVIVTPHASEFVRLQVTLGLDPAGQDALRDPSRRAQAVTETADALGGTVLLKGATTLIADPGADRVIAVEAPTSWLATAGTGDVLAGVIGAVVAGHRAAATAAAPVSTAPGGTPFAELVAAAVWLHGLAGRIAAGEGSGHPIVALDVAEALPAAFARTLTGAAGDLTAAETPA